MEEFPTQRTAEVDPMEEPQIIYADAEGVHCLVTKIPMHRAAFYGDLEEVRRLIELGMSVDSQNIQGYTPLMWAARRGRYEVVELLIRNKCNVNIDEYYGVTPLMISAVYGHKVIFDLLLQCGASTRVTDRSQFGTLLHWASRHGWVDVVQRLVERGECATDTAAKGGMTPLMWAAVKGRKDVVAYLIQAGADVNRWSTVNEATALHHCSTYGHPEVVQILIQAGADVNRETAVNKRTALHLASQFGYAEVVQILLEKENIDLNHQDCLGETPLHKASDHGKVEVIEKLLAAGADTSIKNNEGETAFRVGIKKEKLSPKEISLFVQKGTFFDECDHSYMFGNPDIKEHVLKNVNLCAQSIINKFHYQALPTLCNRIPNLAKKLPPMGKFKLNTQEIQGIENFVEFDIKTNFFFNVVNAQPIVLKLMCVKSLILASIASVM